MNTARVGIAVLGPLAISGADGFLAPRDRVVLAALTVRRGEVVSSAVLADALWRDHPPATWGKQIQASVVRLRKALGPGAIETVADGYRLVVPGDDIDSHRFERLVRTGRELAALSASDRAAHQLGEALALWRGPPLPELDGWDPGRTEAARLEELRLEAEEARLDAAVRAGLHRQVLAEARTRVAEEPLREQRWAVLALAQYRSGQQADALRTIRHAGRKLSEELGLGPGPTLVSLEQAILQQDPSLAAVTAVPEPSTACPYQGLVPYDMADAELYFGRATEQSECLRRLADVGVLVVVGPSGSGKSSLVRAGIAAALERDGRRVVVITPGPQPMSALAAAASAHAAVLVVDQCEEAVSLCTDASERSRFFAALAVHGGPLVVALRGDRLGDLAAHPAFAALVERGLYLLKPMDEAGIRAAIEGPARRAGLLLEPGLVDLLVRDVEGEPGALPLLSHALMQTWVHREGRTLTVAGYHASGGIRGAVAQSAELVYEQAAPDQRPLVRDLMLRLVTPSPEGEPVRSRVPRRVIATGAGHEQVIELLVGARLVTSDTEMIELAHEALARAWPRLRAWIDDDADGQRILRHLSVAADTWDSMGRPDAELYRGVRLTRALDWRERSTPALNTAEREFLDASQRHADAERHAARRRRRTVTTVLTAAVVVTATLAAIAIVNERRADDEAARAAEQAELASAEAERANDEAERANDEAQRADQEAERARAQALSASALSALDEDPSLAKLLAVASATSVGPTKEATATLHRAWAADRVTARPGPAYDIAVQAADIDPHGRWMAVAGGAPADGSGKVVDVVELATGSTAWSFTVDEASAWVISPRFTPIDGAHVAAGVFWDPHNRDRIPIVERGGPIEEPPPGLVGIRVWDAGTGELVEEHDVGRCGGFPMAISATHVLVRTLHGPPEVIAACDWRFGTLGAELVDRRSGERRVLSEDSLTHQRGAAMSRDGSTVAYDDIDTDGGRHDVVVADTLTGEVLLRLSPAPADGWGVRGLNNDGSLLLYGDQPIEVWNVSTSEQVTAFDGHRGGSGYAAFSPVAPTVLSTGVDGTMREWEIHTGEEVRVYPGIAEGPIAPTSAGRVLTIGHSQSNNTPAALIDVGARGELGAVETCPGVVAADSLEVAGALAVFHITCDGATTATTYVVDVPAQSVLHALPGHQGPALAVSPDGARYVRQEGEGTIHGPLTVRDVRTGAKIVTLDGMCNWDSSLPLQPEAQTGCATYPATPFGISVQRLAWSPDGTMIAGAAGTAVVAWDAESGALLHAESPDPGRFSISDVRFTPDSEVLLSTSNDSKHRVISTRTWEVVSTGIGGTALGLVGFSSDGSQVLVAVQLMAHTGSELVWFDTTRQQIAMSRFDLHEGSLRSVALSPDGALVATAASDGLVRVWDAPSLELVHEIPFGDTPIEGVAFVNDRHLAVTPQHGNLQLVTTDTDELLDIAGRSLTRGFTATECNRFGFGDDCPTLAELRGGSDGAGDTAMLNGSYEVRWTIEQFDTALAAAGEPKIAGRSTADGYPGTYTVTLDDGRFDIVHDQLGAFCTGHYVTTGDRVRLVAERREPQFGCYPGRFLDATFRVTDETLELTAATGHPVDVILFAGQPLARAEG